MLCLLIGAQDSQPKYQPICEDLTLAAGLSLLQSKSSLLCPASLLGSTVKGHGAGLLKLIPLSLSENLIKFAYVCRCRYVRACACGGQKLQLGVFPSAYFLRQHLSLNLELFGPARLGGQKSSGVLLLLPP